MAVESVRAGDCIVQRVVSFTLISRGWRWGPLLIMLVVQTANAEVPVNQARVVVAASGGGTLVFSGVSFAEDSSVTCDKPSIADSYKGRAVSMKGMLNNNTGRTWTDVAFDVKLLGSAGEPVMNPKNGSATHGLFLVAVKPGAQSFRGTSDLVIPCDVRADSISKYEVRFREGHQPLPPRTTDLAFYLGLYGHPDSQTVTTLNGHRYVTCTWMRVHRIMSFEDGDLISETTW